MFSHERKKQHSIIFVNAELSFWVNEIKIVIITKSVNLTRVTEQNKNLKISVFLSNNYFDIT